MTRQVETRDTWVGRGTGQFVGDVQTAKVYLYPYQKAQLAFDLLESIPEAKLAETIGLERARAILCDLLALAGE